MLTGRNTNMQQHGNTNLLFNLHMGNLHGNQLRHFNKTCRITNLRQLRRTEQNSKLRYVNG